MTKYSVYEHWRLDRDECFYVGKGAGRRPFNMAHRNRHHLAIQAKVAREGCGVEVRMVATGLTHEQACSLEIERIAFWRSAGIDLANLTTGGEGAPGHVVPESIKQRIAALRRGKGAPPHHRKMIEAARTPDARERQSKARLGRKAQPMLAHVMESLRAVNKGKRAKNVRRVKCLDDDHVFESALDAAIHYGVHHSSLCSLCRHAKRSDGSERRSIGGRRFEYVKEMT